MVIARTIYESEAGSIPVVDIETIGDYEVVIYKRGDEYLFEAEFYQNGFHCWISSIVYGSLNYLYSSKGEALHYAHLTIKKYETTKQI